jgi:hypothetical protein
MFDTLLTDDPSNWPWNNLIRLPLIPLALIFSRLPLKSNVTPLIPLLLAWPTSSRVAGLFIFPIVREGYKRAFSQFAKWVFDVKSGTGEHGLGQRGERDMQRVSMGAVADDEPFLRIRANAHMDEEDGPALPAPSQEQAAARTVVQDKPTAQMAPTTTIRTTTTSLGTWQLRPRTRFVSRARRSGD